MINSNILEVNRWFTIHSFGNLGQKSFNCEYFR